MSEEKQLAKVYHFDSYGKRQEKYDRLSNTDFDQVSWEELNPTQPYYFFVPKDFEAMEKYDKGFSVSEIFKVNISGVETAKDALILKNSNTEINELLNDFKKLELNDLLKKYKFNKEKIIQVKNDIENAKVINYSYKPFDFRKTLYSSNSGGVLWRPRGKLNNKFLGGKNVGLILMRNLVNNPKLESVFVSKNIIDKNFYGFQSFIFPLYLYNQDNLNQTEEKLANFNMETIAKIEEKLVMKYLGIDPEISSGGQGSEGQNGFTAQDLFDYIYAVLYSKSYREKFQEFLKIDFPKIPFDVNKQTFFEMVKLGGELRKYHLMEHQDIKPQNYFTSYPIEGDNLVDKIKYKDNKVFINENQYFENVAKEVWEFYIGGYQPAQKWIKGRKGRTLNSDDIEHYIKITFVLKKTIELMEEIEKVFKI